MSGVEQQDLGPSDETRTPVELHDGANDAQPS